MAKDTTTEIGPMTEAFDLRHFTHQLINDLQLLRAKKISIKEAHARTELARQVLRSIGLIVNASKMLEQIEPKARRLSR